MMYLDHLVINSKNVKKTVDFYESLLSCSTERWESFLKGEVKFPSLRISDTFIIDVFPPHMWQETTNPAHKNNINHFCIAMSPAHWMEVLEHISKNNIQIEKGPDEYWGARGNGMSIFVKDPEGNTVEIRKYEA